ncbi:hypothetical protein EDC01DRAFT_207125 [Geopyxis carbonaria]|nr:hypothetical protein EDC01DRAFT_207125 [Geopyxis carbonaria]
MDDAKEQFARFRESVPARLTTLQDRVATMPERLQNVADKLPRPSSSHSRSSSTGAASPPPPLARAPALSDPAYDDELATLAGRILFRSGRDPVSGGPLLILSAAAFPDASVVDYNKLLPYVLANLPGDDELGGMEDSGMRGGYSVVFFAGGAAAGAAKNEKGNRPNWAWTLQAYHLVGPISQCLSWFVRDMEEADGDSQLGRAVRKKIKKLWVVHERAWVRILFEMMAGVVSVKFRKKVVHLNTLTDLARELDITQLFIPPAVYLHDRKLESEIVLPNFPPPPVFGAPPFHHAHNPPRVGDNTPIPQVLVDTSEYIRARCLNVEGILRVPPSAALLDIAKECYNRRQQMRWEDWGPHTAAGLIKLYYRSLPEPMIPQECYGMLMTLSPPKPSPHTVERMLNAEEKEAQFQTVQSLLTAETAGLPQFSRILFLRHLLPLLALIATRQEANKMTPANLAVCIGGSLARSSDVAADAHASPGIRKFIEIAIERLEELAPALPVRRRKHTDPSDRRSMTLDSTGDSPPPPSYSLGTRTVVPRKKVPSLTMPRWENVDNKAAVARKPLPESPLGYSPSSPLARSASVPPAEKEKKMASPTASLPPSRSPTATFAAGQGIMRKPTPPVRPSSAASVASSVLPAYTPPVVPAPTATKHAPFSVPSPAAAKHSFKPPIPSPTTTASTCPPPAPRSLSTSAATPSLHRKLSTPSIFIDSKPPAPAPEFARPPLRRVVSANFAARRNSFIDGPGGGGGSGAEAEKVRPVIRRVKSTIGRTGGGGISGSGIGGSGGIGAIGGVGSGSVRELSQLYEERAQSVEALRAKKLW